MRVGGFVIHFVSGGLNANGEEAKLLYSVLRTYFLKPFFFFPGRLWMNICLMIGEGKREIFH